MSGIIYLSFKITTGRACAKRMAKHKIHKKIMGSEFEGKRSVGQPKQ